MNAIACVCVCTKEAHTTAGRLLLATITRYTGCILVAAGLHDLNNDGLQNVTPSRIAIKALNKLRPSKISLHIL